MVSRQGACSTRQKVHTQSSCVSVVIVLFLPADIIAKIKKVEEERRSKDDDEQS